MYDVDYTFDTIIKGATFLFIGFILTKLAGYIYRLLIAQLGPSDYGIFSIGYAIVSVITVIAIQGLNSGILRYVSDYRSRNDSEAVDKAIGTAIRFVAIASVALAVILFIFANWISIHLFREPGLAMVIKILSLTIPLDAIRNIALFAIRGVKNTKYELYARHITENATKILFTIALIYTGFKLFGATLAYLLAILVSFILTIFFLQKSFNLQKILKCKSFNKELLAYSQPLLLNQIISSFMVWISTFFLGMFTTSRDVGIFNAAEPTARLTYLFPGVIIALFIPAVATLYTNRNLNAIQAVYRRLTRWILLVNAPILIAIVSFPKQILGALFGVNYVDGATALLVLVAGYFTIHLAICSREVLLLFKDTKAIFKIICFGLIFNIAGSLTLIPRYGMLGAAITTSGANILVSLLFYARAYKFIRVLPFNRNIIRLIFSATVTFFIARFIAAKFLFNNIYLQIFVLGVTMLASYGVLLFLTGSIYKSDLRMLMHLLARFRNKLY